jgi:hypothetical protein
MLYLFLIISPQNDKLNYSWHAGVRRIFRLIHHSSSPFQIGKHRRFQQCRRSLV